MRGDEVGRAAWLAGCLAVLAAVSAAAIQERVGSGHALDANLRVGDNGYNSRTGPRTRSYQKSFYTPSQVRDVAYDQRQAFDQERVYRVNRSMAAYDGRRTQWRAEERAAEGAWVAAPAFPLEEPRGAGAGEGAPPERAQRQRQEISYGVGLLLGEEVRRGLERDGVEVDPELVMEGFADGLKGEEPDFPREEVEGLLAALHDELKNRMVKHLSETDPEFRKRAEENLARSRAFHEVFGRQPGVVTLDSGAQYKILRQGSGPSPGPGDVVVVNVSAKLLDGTPIKEEQGAETPVSRVVEGGRQVLQMMRPGDKWQVAIPPELAHGAGGRFPDIGPNESLVGEVELVAIR